ncbi:UDP-N-acetylmuramoyl-L-alanyl-D-glutamate--2,6-diaminopimelate ligase [Hydrogenophaga sp. OTU3427]|uniref:UDP-N-acetylmuramoyl-L-alanyl-D-glutamate--2, 6-diaminopimelate ligase n=1 Tax=Hydrogenophaga sp. OTU3427 TaxID=3043856 RepID=UPI00313EF53A
MRHLHGTSQAVAWLRERGCRSLQADSRRVGPGDGFVAWPGAAADGRRFVHQALAAGAAACLVERDGVEAFAFDDERIATLGHLKTASAPLAADFYRQPSEALDVVAITGTNGKTSSAWWLAQLLQAAGQPCAVVGTLGLGQPGGAWTNTGLTTPDPFMFQGGLRGFADNGVRACAVEASSIGIVEGRLDATRVAVALFTNFTQDHLDYHGDMASYWRAKRALFDWAGLRAAVVNIDDPQGAALALELAQRAELDLWTVSITEPGARLRVSEHAVTARGMSCVIREAGDPTPTAPLELPLVGSYNLSNLVGVIAAARALGVDLRSAIGACAALTPVPGRMQVVPADAGAPLVLVDYAHTPDALDKALVALQPLAGKRQGRLWCLVGCGGDRDPIKRPLMAAVAEREADVLLLTSDNPRSEDPLAILAQMSAGLREPSRARVLPDRAEAIAQAVRAAAPQDVVLIAGKGHEDYQDIQGQRHPFSDVLHATAALAARGPGAQA